ncbi:MAG TPA: plastocyanin/azurin family copper-binding protein [Solirubrobacterales bacterium]|nr:plastocyanin/azurin family copper-binding protein [Solirubrobacterales bacterium]
MPGQLRRHARLGASLAVAAVAALAVALFGATAAPAAKPKPKPKVVTVNDFYFGPSSVTINKGGKVKWIWSELNTYPHDVHLKKGPKGLTEKSKYSTKTTAVTGAQFVKQFKTPGTYKFICTIHPTEMHLTVTVKK